MRGNWTSMAFSKGTPCTWQTHRHVIREGWLGSPWSEMKALVRNFVYNPEKKHGLFRFSIRVKRWINCFTNVPHFISIYLLLSSFCQCMPPALHADETTSIYIDFMTPCLLHKWKHLANICFALFCEKYTNLIQFRKLDCFHASTIDSKDPSSFTSVEHSPQKPLRQVLKTSYPLMDSS